MMTVVRRSAAAAGAAMMTVVRRSAAAAGAATIQRGLPHFHLDKSTFLGEVCTAAGEVCTAAGEVGTAAGEVGTAAREVCADVGEICADVGEVAEVCGIMKSSRTPRGMSRVVTRCTQIRFALSDRASKTCRVIFLRPWRLGNPAWALYW